MAERTLTGRELNRALLARQLLLERSRLSIPRVLERIAGIQNQYAPNAYIRLWSCVEGFRREDLERALERRTVVQATLLRGTIHLVSARDYWPFLVAIARARRQWSTRIHGGAGDLDRRRLVARVRRGFRGRTCTRRELHELRGDAGPAAWQTIDTDAGLLRAPPSGTWAQRRAHTFALADDWIEPVEVGERQGMEHLVRRYLAAFGPSARADVAKFTSIPAAWLDPVFEHIPLRRFRDERGKELIDLPRAPLPGPDTPAPVRFLPTWDASLLVHARRTGILREEHRRLIFDTKAPQSFPTFLVDGVVAGTWRHREGRVQLEPFERLARSTRRELVDEAEGLAELYR